MSTKYERAKARHWGAPVPGHLPHGSGTYACQIYGCDCPDCLPSGRRLLVNGRKLTKKEREKRLREAKRGKPVPATVKHGIYAYKVYGCRCTICLEARNTRLKRQRASKKARAGGVRTTVFDTITTHWPPTGYGMWTCPDCGQQFRHRPPKEERLAA